MKQKNHSRLVVVTGSRKTLSNHEKKLIKTRLILEAFDFNGPVVLMHGAATGVDEFSGQVAQAHHHSVLPMPAQWDEYQSLAKGRKRNPAGPMRNASMVLIAENMASCGWDVVVYAFPRHDSKGTRDMIARVRSVLVLQRYATLHVHELDPGKNTAPEQSDDAQVPLFVGSTHLVGNPDLTGPSLVRVPINCDRPGCDNECNLYVARECSCICHVTS